MSKSSWEAVFFSSRFAGSNVSTSSSNDKHLPSNNFTNINLESLRFRFSVVKLDDLCFSMSTSFSSDKSISDVGARRPSLELLFGGVILKTSSNSDNFTYYGSRRTYSLELLTRVTLKCRTFLDTWSRIRSPRSALILVSNLVESSSVKTWWNVAFEQSE